MFAQEEMFGDFLVQFQVDPMTDEPKHVMFTLALDHPERATGSHLAVRCATDRVGSVMWWVEADEYLSNSDITVDYRLDEEPAQLNQKWSTTPSGTGALPKWSAMLDLIPVLSRHEQLLVRVYDYRGQGYTYLFSLDGFQDALDAIDCWEPR